MSFPRLRALAAFTVLLPLAVCASAQSNGAAKIEFPAASPLSVLRQRVGLTDFEIVYSRPSVKGRQIFGALEAYGTVWRTGANAATVIRFNTPITFGGSPVPAGTYSLFTIPDRDAWTVILNAEHDQWGAYRYDRARDVARVTVPAKTLSEPVETFTLSLDDLRDESATLTIVWERVRVAVPLVVDVESKLLPQIEAVMAAPDKKLPGVYFNSALFYFDHGQDLNKALAWVNEAIVLNPQAFYAVHLKAKILAKLGRTDEAIAAAQASIELSRAAHDQGYVTLNQDLIKSLK